MATHAERGTVKKSKITAVLLKGSSTWMEVLPGSFDIVEVNFLDDEGGKSGGIVGIKFSSSGRGGRPAWIFAAMDSVAGIQIEESPASSNSSSLK